MAHHVWGSPRHLEGAITLDTQVCRTLLATARRPAHGSLLAHSEMCLTCRQSTNERHFRVPSEESKSLDARARKNAACLESFLPKQPSITRLVRA
eukprot:4453942-Amphidinium_carterae.1